jgi:hypothetical protein
LTYPMSCLNHTKKAVRYSALDFVTTSLERN